MLEQITTFYDYLFIKLDNFAILFDYIFGLGSYDALTVPERYQLLMLTNVFYLLFVGFLVYVFIYILRAVLARL